MHLRVVVAVLALAGLNGRQARPTIFAAGVISTAAPEFAITFSPDGRETFFNRASPDRKSMAIMTARWSAGRWTEPVVAAFSGTYLDVDPFMTPDGSRLFFTSNRPRSGDRPSDFNTWYVERDGDGWSRPIDPGPPLNSDSSEVFVSLTRDGTIAFNSNRDGSGRVYLARPSGAGWTTPEPVTFGRLTDAGNPLVDPDGRFVILVAPGPDDRADLHVSCRTGLSWSEPVPLPGVNSRWADFAPALHPPSTLYFTSERPGVVPALADSIRPPGDIYRVEVPFDRICPAHPSQ